MFQLPMSFPGSLALSPRGASTRVRRRIPQRSRRWTTRPAVESLEARQLLASHPELLGATIAGTKWVDANGDGVRQDFEPGLAGVTVYSDRNDNGRLDRGEPRAVTERDDPKTEADESGRYVLENIRAGDLVIREVVPPGYRQTFPASEPRPDLQPPADPQRDPAVEITPDLIVAALGPGETLDEVVGFSFLPVCIRPWEVDVVAPADLPDGVQVENLTGVQENGCGGDRTDFKIAITGDGQSHEFELQVVNAENGQPFGTVPVQLFSPVPDGAHRFHAAPGDKVDGIDFGNQPRVRPSAISGVKWIDINGDGNRDEDEPGLGGVTIYIDRNENGQLDRNEPRTRTLFDDPTTEQDESGRYRFERLAPGRYVIAEIVPDGFVQTFPGASGEVLASETGQFHPGIAIDLDVTGVDVAPDDDGKLVAEIETTVVWPDSCGQLISDATSHTQIGSHILVELAGHQTGDVCAEVISPEQETVRLEGLEPGNYQVVVNLHETLRDGTEVPTLAALGRIHVSRGGRHVVQLGRGESVEGIDFGNQSDGRVGSIHGRKWEDLDGDGIAANDEPGLPGVTIYVDMNRNGQLDDGEPHALTMEDDGQTDENEQGRYWIEGLRPGRYLVREVVPDGYRQTFPPSPIDPPIPLPVDPGDPDEPIDHLPEEMRDGMRDGILPPRGNNFHVVSVPAGEAVDGIDFGNQPIRPGSIEGVKWLDENGNGRRDDQEQGLGGVTVYLDLNHNALLDDGEPRTVTEQENPETDFDEAGRYRFDGVEPGVWFVREVVPDGYVQTFPMSWIIDPVPFPIPFPDPVPFPPFPIPEFGGAHVVHVASGELVSGIDFGNQPIKPSSIHGVKWIDRNGNGRRDDEDGGLAGVTIYLDANRNGELDEGEQHAVTMEDDPATDFDETGLYWIEGVSAGLQIVREVVPPGFRQTFPGAQFGPLPDPGPLPEPGMLPDRFDDLERWPIAFPWTEGHVVLLRPGQSVDGIDFGNQPVREPASIHGVKWLDRNGNGQRDPDEPGIAGVTIFVDANLNGRLDRDEVSTRTMEDDPATELDETGAYWLRTLPGENLILEVVPRGFEQTFPDPRRRIASPFNLGHIVVVEAGGLVEGIDFGNRRVERETIVSGIKFVDLNGNGERDRGDVGLAGVRIYADYNNNGRRDGNEPMAVSRRDDPDTAVDESGRYELIGLEPGLYSIREIVPRGFRQTFPMAEPRGVDFAAESHDLPGGSALDYELIAAELDVDATGQLGLAMTFNVVWPNGCGQLIAEETEARIVDSQIQVQMYGTQVGEICTLALKPQQQTIHVGPIGSGDFRLRAVLNESERRGKPQRPSFVVEGKIQVDVSQGHHLKVEAGRTYDGIHFGNQPIDDVPPPIPVADLDDDGQIRPHDIDMLISAIHRQLFEERFDFTKDGKVDGRDLRMLVREVLEVPFGDSNLDGRFDSNDLLRVFQAGKYEDDTPGNGTWEDGDWDGDGEVTSRDLLFAFQEGDYERD